MKMKLTDHVNIDNELNKRRSVKEGIMKKVKIFFNGFLLLVIFPSSILAQIEMKNQRAQGSPQFYCYIQNTAGDEDRSRLIVKVNIPFEEVQFLKKATHYQAEAEITFLVTNLNEEQVFAKSYNQTITTTSYDSTTSNRVFHQFAIALEFKPGEYNFICQVMDLDSKNTSQFGQKIILEDFSSQPISISSLSLVNSTSLNPHQTKWLSEQFSEKLKDSEEFVVVLFEIYHKNKNEDFEIGYELRNFRNKRVDNGKFDQLQKDYRTEVYIPFSPTVLGSGRYILSLNIMAGENKLNVEKNIRRQFMTTSVYLPDNLQEAIDQMRYISDRVEVDKIRRAPPKKRKQLFEEFWTSRDPTPGTTTNELMDEYYRRIAFTNVHFSGIRDGWKSDMGMVYVIYGPPNDVVREPFNVQPTRFSGKQIRAYEQWIYFEYNRRFLFADFQGFGEYQLLNPEQIYWDHH